MSKQLSLTWLTSCIWVILSHSVHLLLRIMWFYCLWGCRNLCGSERASYLNSVYIIEKEGKSSVWSEIPTAGNIKKEYFCIFLNYLRKSHPAAGDYTKRIKAPEKLTSLGKAWQWIKFYSYLVCVWPYTLHTSTQPLAKLLVWRNSLEFVSQHFCFQWQHWQAASTAVGPRSFSSCYLVEDLAGSEASLWDQTLKCLQKLQCHFSKLCLYSAGIAIWQQAHADLSTPEGGLIFTIAWEPHTCFGCLPAKRHQGLKNASHKFTLCSSEVIHTLMHFSPNCDTLSLLQERGDTHLHQGIGQFPPICWNIFWSIRLWPALWPCTFSSNRRY